MVGRSLLNKRQLEVLHWIVAGCPERHWPDATYKSTAVALQVRRLVEISKRGGIWSATPTQAGSYYAAKGRYPDGHWTAHQTKTTAKNVQLAEAPATQPHPAVQAEPPPSREDVVGALIQQVQAAGGTLQVDRLPSSLDSSTLARIAARSEAMPEGKKLEMERIGHWTSSVMQLRLVPDPTAGLREKPVPVPTSLSSRHQVTAAYLADADCHGVSAGSLQRAARIIEGIAREASQRGYSARAVSSPDLGGGQLLVTISRWTYSLRMLEVSKSGGEVLDYRESTRPSFPTGSPGDSVGLSRPVSSRSRSAIAGVNDDPLSTTRLGTDSRTFCRLFCSSWSAGLPRTPPRMNAERGRRHSGSSTGKPPCTERVRPTRRRGVRTS